MSDDIKRMKSPSPEPAYAWGQAQELLDQVGGGVVLLDLNLRVQFINAGMARLLGLPVSSFQNKPWPLNVLSPQLSDWQSWLKRAKSGKVISQLWSIERQEGAAVWLVSARRFISHHQSCYLLLIQELEAKAGLSTPIAEAFPRKELEHVAGLGSWMLSLGSNSLVCSDEMLAILGLEPAYFEGSYGALLERIFPDDRLKFNEKIQKNRQRLDCFEMELRLVTADKQKITVVLLRAEVSGDGRYMLGTMIDISEHQRQVEGLRLAATVFKYTAEGVIVCDQNNHIIAVNPAFSQITGYSEEEIRGRSPGVLKSGRHDLNFYHEMWRSIQERGIWIGEIWNRRKDGEIYPSWLNVSVVLDDVGRVAHYVGVFADISSLKRSQERLDFLANHDPLTGLANRRLFVEQLSTAVEHARREGGRLGILFVDLDRFKQINDTLGHHIGDELLIEVAHRMKASVRQEDVVARQGGDEFVILLNTVKQVETATNVAHKVRESIFQTYSIEGNIFHLSCSVGVALFPDDGDSAEKLLAAADRSMYRAKAMGRNQCAFASDEMSKQAYAHYVLEVGLRHALEQGGIQCVYTSYINLKTHAIAALRVDWRWDHPWLGEIPAEFLDEQVHQTAIAFALGEFLLEAASAAMVYWQQESVLQCPLVVPILPSLFQHREFVPLVKRCLQESGLSPHLLYLEIETAIAIKDVALTQATIAGLPSGVRFVLSGMGRAPLSLPALQVWPIAALSLDPMLIRDINDDSRDLALVSALTAIAPFMNVAVWAGPVLSKKELLVLRKAGLTAAFGPELHAKDFPAQGIITP